MSKHNIYGLENTTPTKMWEDLTFYEACGSVSKGGHTLTESRAAFFQEQIQDSFLLFNKAFEFAKEECPTLFTDNTFKEPSLDGVYFIMLSRKLTRHLPNLRVGLERLRKVSTGDLSEVIFDFYKKCLEEHPLPSSEVDDPYFNEAMARIFTDIIIRASISKEPEQTLELVPVKNRSDKILLENYFLQGEDTQEVEEELIRRSRGKNFIVFADEGEWLINIEATLSLLKNIRKMPDHSYIRDVKGFNIYSMAQLNWRNRLRYMCPLDESVLFRGTCPKCNSDFTGVPYADLQAIHVAYQGTGRRQLAAWEIYQRKGIDGLCETIPQFVQAYERKKRNQDLPTLITLDYPIRDEFPEKPKHFTKRI